MILPACWCIIQLLCLWTNKILSAPLLISSLCPASQAVGVGTDPTDHFNYPLDIYSTEYEKLKSIPDIQVDCLSYDRESSYPNMTHHRCPKFVKDIACPIKEQFIELTLKETKSRMNFPALCKISEIIQKNPSALRIYALGGSVTIGVDTDGCTVRDDCVMEDGKKSTYLPCSSCTWSYYLENWLHKSISPLIKVQNIGRSSADSTHIAEMLTAHMKQFNVSRLSATDVVFIDHSTNDHGAASMERFKYAMERGIDSLIRKLYGYSDPHSLPTIIMLATERIDRGDTTIRNQGANSDYWYTKMYQKIAKQYNIPVWNFDDFYHSKYLAKANLPYEKYITRQYNIGYRGGVHPSWHVHLFQADMMATIMTQELNECNAMSTQARTDLITTHYLNDYDKLPAEILVHNDAKSCSDNDHKFLSLSFENLVSHKDTAPPAVGSWKSDPENEWQLKMDAKGRAGGFIHEYDPTTFNSSGLEPLNSGPWLYFKPVNLTRGDISSGKVELLVTFSVFHTYENAGQVVFHFCGRWINLFDALWKEKFSLPATLTFISKPGYCSGGDPNEPLTLALRHGYQTLNYDSRPRGNQKFKLYGINACLHNE